MSLIAPYFVKGETLSILDLYFKVTDKLSEEGRVIYNKHKKVLVEAQSVVLSGGNIYTYDDYNERVKLNYAVGFMKLELERIRHGK